MVTAAAPTAVVDISFADPPCAPAALFELRSCLRRAFCGFAFSFEIAVPFSSRSFCTWLAATAIEGCVVASPVAMVVRGAADVLLESAATTFEDEVVGGSRVTGACGGGVIAASFGRSRGAFERTGLAPVSVSAGRATSVNVAFPVIGTDELIAGFEAEGDGDEETVGGTLNEPGDLFLALPSGMFAALCEVSIDCS